MSRFPGDLFLSDFPIYMAYVMQIYSQRLWIGKQIPLIDIALDYTELRFRVKQASVKCASEVATHISFIIKETIAKDRIAYTSIV